MSQENMEELPTEQAVLSEDTDGSNDQGVSEAVVVKETKPILTGDAEADELDLVSMPVAASVNLDLKSVHRSRRVVIHPATVYDMFHEVIGEIMRNQVCDDISLRFINVSEESGMQGVISLTFSSTKQAAEYIPFIQSIRPDIIVEQAPTTDVATTLVNEWIKERATQNPSTESLVIVKNLDPVTASVEKLSAIFPDAEDIVIASQPDASNKGKLKGRKHAYLLYKTKSDAQTAVEMFHANPLELDDDFLVVSTYKEPPKNVPKGYLSLSARMLVLRHMARFKGLMVRAQEDPLFPVQEGWQERLNLAMELIGDDDAARDELGLPRPTLADFKDMTNLKTVDTKREDLQALQKKLADKATSSNNSTANGGQKRLSTGDSTQPKKVVRGSGSFRGGAQSGRGSSVRGTNQFGRGANRGANRGVKPLMVNSMRSQAQYGFATGPSMRSGFSMGGGYSMEDNSGYQSQSSGYGSGYSQGLQRSSSVMLNPRMTSVIHAAARAALRGQRGSWM